MRTNALLLAGLLFSCGPTMMPSPTGGGSGGTGGGGGSTVVTCPTTTSGPTMHGSNLSANETWTAATSPHVLTWDVYVLNGATLTIEPCAEIQLSDGRTLGTRAGGTLLAEGTATQPIRIHGKQGATKWWVEFNAPGNSRLAWVDVEGGGDATAEYGAIGVRSNGGLLPAPPTLFVDHVTVRNSKGIGVAVSGWARFADGSHDLVITGGGSATYPYPMTLEEHSIDSLPTGTYTGNLRDEFLLRLAGSGTAGDGLKVDATLHNRGIPYRVPRHFNVSANEDGKKATLTIEPGVKIKMTKGFAFKVEAWTNSRPAGGVLRALGTADQPIVFTSAEDAPAPGDWQGLWFGGVPDAQNKLDHVIIEYAGADCSCSLASCAALTDYEGGVMLTNRPAGGTAFVTNSTFRNILGHGVVEGWFSNEAGEAIDFTPTNTFENLSGCVQTKPGSSVSGGCPNPKPACW